MEEKFLHFVWQYQYINKPLKTTDGEPIVVHKTGHANSDAGPDFLGAQVEIGGLTWAGNVEIHVKASDWYAHSHDSDPGYENAILHVVWENDKKVKRPNGTLIPTLSLKNQLDPLIYDRYKRLIKSGLSVPCEKQVREIDKFTKILTLEKVVMERLITKSQLVNELVAHNNGDWEESAYQLLAKTFGFKVNSDQFLDLAQSIKLKKILTLSDDLSKVEAFFFGQAGFLEGELLDDYQTKLKNEYAFLTHKHQISPRLSMHQWKFLRLRPANFPTIRIAQFSKLLFSVRNLFSWVIETNQYKDILKQLKVSQSNYWKANYRFGLPANGKIAALGKSSAENVIINAIIPMLVAYGKSIDDDSYVERAVSFLQEIPSENNKITRLWEGLDWPSGNSFDSQGMIQLYNEYCQKRRCLSCNIGMKIIRPV